MNASGITVSGLRSVGQTFADCRQRTGNEVSLWSSEGAPRSRETAIADCACAAGSVVQLTAVSSCMRLVLCCELLLHLPPVFDRVWFSKPPVVVKEA